LQFGTRGAGNSELGWLVTSTTETPEVAAVAVKAYEAQRAAWPEKGTAKAAIETIASRVKLGRLVDQDETGLTVEYGSPAMFRLMGGLFTPKWFPLSAQVVVVGNDHGADVEVVGTDRKGWYLVGDSGRRGKRSLGEKVFIKQFRRVCTELSGSSHLWQEPCP
jgi:hypothetical protein